MLDLASDSNSLHLPGALFGVSSKNTKIVLIITLNDQMVYKMGPVKTLNGSSHNNKMGLIITLKQSHHNYKKGLRASS